LFVFREAGKYIIQFLNPKRSSIAYLVDHALAKTASGFVSQLLLSMSTQFRLNQPQFNILSKADMLTDAERDVVLRWSKDPDILYDSIIQENPSVYREVSENLFNVIQNFESYPILIPTGKEEFFGIEDLYTQIQMQFEGGEDLMRD
jgi:hypothetical protein